VGTGWRRPSPLDRSWYLRVMAARAACADRRGVSPDQSVAEVVPRTYRAILDAVGRLEQLDAWEEAARLRSQAVTTYARRWDEGTLRSLERILASLETACRVREHRLTQVA
jgi:hypothetical protein